MPGASIEATLELWASSLREVKRQMRQLFTQDRAAINAGLFLDGLLGNERRNDGMDARGGSRRSRAVGVLYASALTC